ncbi:Demethylrebeccamycin-D-glucose O-methyltransferase [Gimesia panareensis]|uniref:Demethylrebeccamycin-D-glucose O-methyltransferase n=2 Tax=Gimesia panareensis TaxID=2527978 RepID=A0A518FUN3_9PLAN|nr:Demethylrebeccamycin-D-glucose O-methyltransferase [Gimesia panareensis]QDV20048.1 Demethylrebeccamycin-D-glucose O-methyltransferase [Gimesia panareensis]
MCAKHRYCMEDPSLDVTDKLLMEQIQPGSRVLDLGCGDGRLLARLRDERDASVLGMEIDIEQHHGAIARGVPVIQADLDEGLHDIPDLAFDYVVLSQTLQQVLHPKQLLEEMVRVARQALVVVPNFGNWRIRLQVLKQGRAPVTEVLPYEWYNTPNLHLMSMHDFQDLMRLLGIEILKEIPIINHRAVEKAWLANLRAQQILYVLQRQEQPAEHSPATA